MPFILQAIYFCLLMLLVPLGVGKLLWKDTPLFSPEVYLTGLCTCFAGYEVIGLVFSMVLETSLTALTVCWGVPVLLLAIWGWHKAIKQKALSISVLTYSKTEKWLFAAIMVVLFIQVARAVTGLVVNNDDFMYCAQATTSVYTNTINQFEPHTGRPTDPRNGYYYIALWPILWGSMSQLTGIHPAIIMRTLLPIFMIPCAYMATYLILKVVFRDNDNREKSLSGILLLMVAYEVMACNDGMKQWWLLLVSWFGKSVAPNMICPFLFYIFLRIEDEQYDSNSKCLWLTLFLTCIGGCLVSVSCFSMIPFLLGILGIAHWFRTHEWRTTIKLFCCIAPCLVLFLWSLSVGSY